MSNVEEQPQVDIRELMRLLWSDRVLIVVVTLLSGLVAAGISILTPKKYEASIVVSPVSSNAGGQLGGLGAIASQLGGLAALADISVGGDSKKSESIAVLQSESLTSDYIRARNLLPILFAKKWDAERKEWKVADRTKVPTEWEANRYFKQKIRSVKTDNKTGLVTMTIIWKDPVLAANWANDLVRMTNDHLRAKAIAESERNIAYLKGEAAKTDSVEARQAIYSIMEAEINHAMIAKGSQEYAFKIIDPAVAPEKASSPKKKLWTALGLFAGGLLSVLASLVRRAWRAN